MDSYSPDNKIDQSPPDIPGSVMDESYGQPPQAYPGGANASGGYGQPPLGPNMAAGYGQPAPGPNMPGGYPQPAPGSNMAASNGQTAPGLNTTGGYGQPAPGSNMAASYGQTAPGLNTTGGYGQPALGPNTAGGYGQALPGSTGNMPAQSFPQTAPVGNGANMAGGFNQPAPPGYNNAAGGDVASDGVKPSAPMENLVIPGYEGLKHGEESDFASAPPAYEPVEAERVDYKPSKAFQLNEDDAREALLEYVSQQCCYGKGAAKKMKLDDAESSAALHYTLETFMETRSTKWAYTSYGGGFVDGPQNGVAPQAWDMPCTYAELFKNQTVLLEVPHTSTVGTCFKCFGRGCIQCHHCHGRGSTRCHSCGGRGSHGDRRCNSCHGRGSRRCSHCNNGMVRCPLCHGTGSVRKFIQLTVNFKNHVASHVIEGTDLPDELIRDVTGEVVFEQSALMVAPVRGYPDPTIDTKSSEFVADHAQLPSRLLGRVLHQRQKLQSVPVFECSFEYSDKHGRFWVYGLQHKVYTKDYPHTCLCCTIC